MLGDPYPNPFSNLVHIPFNLEKSKSDYQVIIAIYDMLGQKVLTLSENSYSEGFYEATWDGRNKSGHYVSKGMYICAMMVNQHGITTNLQQFIILE